jgi:2-oxo-3-hexenedioate decarboxylase
MKLDIATVKRLAEYLESAELHAREVTKITDDHPEMDFEDAYAIQYEIRRRKETSGSRIVGLKADGCGSAKLRFSC